MKRLACDYCQYLEGHNIPIPAYAQPWWTKHKQEDAMRLAAEAERRRKDRIRKRVLSTMTKEEKKALGIQE